jgi:hypothetical protein
MSGSELAVGWATAPPTIIRRHYKLYEVTNIAKKNISIMPPKIMPIITIDLGL